VKERETTKDGMKEVRKNPTTPQSFWDLVNSKGRHLKKEGSWGRLSAEQPLKKNGPSFEKLCVEGKANSKS